jgi:hypothetical protein
MKAAALAGLALILMPWPTSACATCIASPFGDQTYSWPYLGLILLPFGLMAAIVGILGYLNWKAHLGRRGASPATACGAHGHGKAHLDWKAHRLGGYFGAKDDPQIIKETT